ncbi:hypothetical protein DRP04_11340 [Archaeoglobales archaeon]|nr:MAG: hypothetical protein DRP04_11340 [Archaeoglobales archaeon]
MSDEYWNEFHEVSASLGVRVHVEPYNPMLGLGFPDMISDEIYRTFDTYVHARPVVAWEAPIFRVLIAPAPPKERAKGIIGKVESSEIMGRKLNFTEVGNAQAWLSTKTGYCIIWECYLYKGVFIENGKLVNRRDGYDWETLRKLWLWFENYLKTEFQSKIFLTHDSDVLYEKIPEKYIGFLKSLGYKYKEEQEDKWRYKTMIKEVL